VMAVTGLGAAELKELRDGLQPFAGRMPNLAG
ncbi:MAG TPA: MarR family transcriptional regulator, partial [Microbacterium sp.]|nr:MarR family transcriptional regulator [Microbacterium sp.]